MESFDMDKTLRNERKGETRIRQGRKASLTSEQIRHNTHTYAWIARYEMRVLRKIETLRLKIRPVMIAAHFFRNPI